MAIITELNCNLREAVHVKYLDGNLFSQDVYGNALRVIVMDGDEPATLAGTVSGTAIREDGSTVALTDSRIDENVATVVLPAAAYAVPGVLAITIKISDTNTVTTLAYVVANVYRTSTDTPVDPGTIIPSITTLIEQIAEAVASIPADYSTLWTSLAPAFNQNRSGGYKVGEYVTYDGGLWKFINNHSGSWSASDAAAVNIGTDLYNLSGAVSVICGGLAQVAGFTTGKGYNTTNNPIDISSPTTNAQVNCICLECQPGDVFTYSGYTTTSYRGWAFLNSTGTRLSSLPTAGAKTNVVITAPTNTAYVIFNVNNGYNYSVWKGSLKEKQDKLVYDSAPVQYSTNPVESNGLFDIENAFEVLNGIEIINGFQHGYGYNTTGTTIDVSSPTANSAVDCAYAACQEGDKFTYTGHGSTSYYAIVFIDSSGNILEKKNFGGSDPANKYVMAAPQSSAYVVFNCIHADGYAVWKGAIDETAPSNPGGFDWEGKNVAIIGDSISTNGDYSASNPLGNVPEIVVHAEDVGIALTAYVTLWDVYKTSSSGGSYSYVATGKTIGGHLFTEEEVGTEVTVTPTEDDIGKTIGVPKNNNAASTVTWWEVAQSVLGFNAIPVCWSGSSITDHEENIKYTAGGSVSDNGKYIYKCSPSFHPSQVRKCGIRTPGTTGFDSETGKINRTPPDVIIIYRGTNDLSHGPGGRYSRLTDDLDSFPTTYPTEDTYIVDGSTRYSYVKGMRLLIKTLHDTYPNAKIMLCTLNYFRRISNTAIYTDNGVDNWLSYNNMIRRLADYESCGLIEFDKDGLTYWNAADGYYTEGTSSSAYWTHPNTTGQKFLGNRALIDMRKLNAED